MRDVWGYRAYIFAVFLFCSLGSILSIEASEAEEVVCPSESYRVESQLGFELEERCVRKLADGTVRQHGPFIWWFDRSKGIKRLQGEYFDDRETGLWTRYSQIGEKESARVTHASQVFKSSETRYQNGLRHGISKAWTRDGHLTLEKHYVNGELKDPPQAMDRAPASMVDSSK